MSWLPNEELEENGSEGVCVDIYNSSSVVLWI